MLDLVIENATIADGTGEPGWVGSIGVRDGRIVALGGVEESGSVCVDASDLVVAPGFIDVHTHYDAQAFWDPTLGPSPLHGVTSVFGGNCGFSTAPLTPEGADYLMRMLSVVEGMPTEALSIGVPWDWNSTEDFFARIDGTLTPNTGWLVGHSALRCAVMGDEHGSAASAEQLQGMQKLLRAGLEAGAMGFSSSWAAHRDHLGHPVPSRAADVAEFKALCEVVGRFPGTTLEFAPGLERFDERFLDILAVMSGTARRTVNWNALLVELQDDDLIAHQLSADDRAAAAGGRVVALTAPDSRRHRLNFISGIIFGTFPGWDRFMALTVDEKIAYLQDKDLRAGLERSAETTEGPLRRYVGWADYIVVEAFSPVNEEFSGRSVGDAARTLGTSAWEALVQIVLADELKTVVMLPDKGQDDRTWRRRVDLWRDPRVVIGASDAGAHLDMSDAFCYTTTVLGTAVRERELLSLEEAVAMLTSKPAALYGLRDRGVIAPGGWADLVIFDPETIGPGPVSTRFDLPGGASRVYGAAEGIEHVFVGGVEAVRGTEFTEARPGRLIKSGRDSITPATS